ncbi:hypothetical protein BCS62_14265 [Vibrio cyclitrophicus]
MRWLAMTAVGLATKAVNSACSALTKLYCVLSLHLNIVLQGGGYNE